jgi:hypothetical protein
MKSAGSEEDLRAFSLATLAKAAEDEAFRIS